MGHVDHAAAFLAAVEQKLAARDLAAAEFDEAHERERGDGFARAGFAHDADGFAWIDIETDILDADHGAVLGLKLDTKALERGERMIEHVCLSPLDWQTLIAGGVLCQTNGAEVRESTA